MSSSSSRLRHFWSDVRFLIGIGLVGAAIAAVWFIVDSAQQTHPVLQSTRTIVLGEVLSTGDFRVVDVGLGVASDSYLGPGQLDPGAIATRTISTGELLPASAVADADAALTTTVVIESSARLSRAVAPGAVVELWHAPPSAEFRGFEEPRILVASATVAALLESGGMVSSSSVSLELVVDRSEVPAVLGAISAGSALSVVPIGGGS